MPHTLITGFTPFDGREVNASWVAASSVTRKGVDRLEIPVLWGEPMKVLQRYCHERCPQMIISLGEGREGWFDIETIALNNRKERPDNEGCLPQGKPISGDGPGSISASINAGFVQRGLTVRGYPSRISSEAGQFLCEEILFVLEQLKDSHHQLDKVLFCHVPPYGTTVHIKGQVKSCNKNILAEFANALLDITSS